MLLVLEHKIIEYNNYLYDQQYGFHPGHSCETQLLATIDDLVKDFNAGYQTDVILLDFSKAFD